MVRQDKKEAWKNWLIGILVLIVIVESLALLGVFTIQGVRYSPNQDEVQKLANGHSVEDLTTNYLEPLSQALHAQYTIYFDLYNQIRALDDICNLDSESYDYDACQSSPYTLSSLNDQLALSENEINVLQNRINEIEAAIELRKEMDYAANPPDTDSYADYDDDPNTPDTPGYDDSYTGLEESNYDNS